LQKAGFFGIATQPLGAGSFTLSKKVTVHGNKHARVLSVDLCPLAVKGSAQKFYRKTLPASDVPLSECLLFFNIFRKGSDQETTGRIDYGFSARRFSSADIVSSAFFSADLVTSIT
jgi:hypothetical protein